VSIERNIPDKKRVIHAWAREHQQCQRKFMCSHCSEQLWSRYKRVVVAVMNRKYPTLEVLRYCHDCM